jgi:vacuolar-type H+-ATPase subunit I/STV1
MTGLATSARQASNSKAMSGAARLGFAARGFVYIVIGWLAIQIATGDRGHQANQRGALADVANHSFGTALLVVLGIGFGAYAGWRFSEAAFGTATDGKKTSARLKSLGRGIVYAGLCISTFTFLAGSSSSNQSSQQATLTARVMKHSFGRWLVGLVGLIVLIMGVVWIVEGFRRKFERDLRMHELTGRTRTVVVGLGTVGTAARGVVFAIAGGLIIDAAVTFDPKKSRGLDGALRTLADQTYGPYLLGLVAAGLIAFGLYGFALARWAKT